MPSLRGVELKDPGKDQAPSHSVSSLQFDNVWRDSDFSSLSFPAGSAPTSSDWDALKQFAFSLGWVQSIWQNEASFLRHMKWANQYMGTVSFFLLSLNHIPDGRWCPPQLGRKPLVNKTNKTQTATIKLDVLVIATQARTRAGVGMVLSSLLCWHCEALASYLHRLDPSVEVRLVDLMEPPYAAGAREEIASIGSSIWQNCNHL